jgi:hypothetical protein
MPQAQMDKLFMIWKASVLLHGGNLPFRSAADLLSHIDSVPYGHFPWIARKMSFPGVVPEEGAPQWMTDTYDWYYRDPLPILRQQLANPDFNGRFDTAAYQEFKPNGSRRYKNFMSARFAWNQSVWPNGRLPILC